MDRRIFYGISSYRIEVQLEEYKVFKVTPQGYWIDYASLYDRPNDDFVRPIDYSGMRWIAKKVSRRRFACPTKFEAMISFLARKRRQKRIIEDQLDRVSVAISKGELMLKNKDY